MALMNTVTNQFLASMGITRPLERAAEEHLKHFYFKVLTTYRTEIQYERARLMRQSPMDYRAVRQLDRDLDDITSRLRQLELEQMN